MATKDELEHAVNKKLLDALEQPMTVEEVRAFKEKIAAIKNLGGLKNED